MTTKEAVEQSLKKRGPVVVSPLNACRIISINVIVLLTNSLDVSNKLDCCGRIKDASLEI